MVSIPSTPLANAHARRRASAGGVGVGGSGRRDWTVTGMPVRCMNRCSAVGWPTGRPSTGACDDRSAQRRRCPGSARGVRGGVHRPHVPERVAAAAGLRGRGGGVLRRPPRPPLRLHGADGPDDQGVRRRHPRLHRRAGSGAGPLRQGPAQGRGHRGVPQGLHPARGGAVRGAGPGERRGVAHPAAVQPGDGGPLRLAGAFHGVHQPLLLLLCRFGLRPVLPEVRHLFPLHREIVHQRQ